MGSSTRVDKDRGTKTQRISCLEGRDRIVCAGWGKKTAITIGTRKTEVTNMPRQPKGVQKKCKFIKEKKSDRGAEADKKKVKHGPEW